MTGTGQVRIHAPGQVRLDSVELPECGPRDAIVEVHACGICGSDLSYIRLGGLAGPGGEPMPLGHELAGVVKAVGAEVTDVVPGQRVVVHPAEEIGTGSNEGGLADAVFVREAARGGRLFPIPDDMPITVAALAEPVAVGMHAAEQLHVDVNDKVAVFGCGPIGLAAIASLADRGLTDIVAIDLSETRRRLAEQLGASETIDPATQKVWRELERIHGTAPLMFGHSAATSGFIEASGSQKVLTDIIDRAGTAAHISVVALHYNPVPVNFLNVLMKELVIRGSINYPARFADAIDLLQRRDLSPMITNRFSLDDIDAALEVLSGSKDAMDRVPDIAKAKGIKRALPLAVSAPFHCPLMQPAAQKMAEALAAITIRPLAVPVLANVIATPVSEPDSVRQLLVTQVTGRVRWRESILALKGFGITATVEFGGNKVLSGMVKRIDPELQMIALDTPADLEAFGKVL